MSRDNVGMTAHKNGGGCHMLSNDQEPDAALQLHTHKVSHKSLTTG